MDKCQLNEDCNFMFQCIKGSCQHQPIFPLQIYTILIYLLIPIASGLCNLTGTSMGIFKISIFMNLLRYTVEDSTAIVQAVVIGAAFPNFLSIIMQRHPNAKTSLVNYNLVYIFIPCSLFGSTFGALLQSILSEFVLDILMIIMFSYFVYSFFYKIKGLSTKQQYLKASLLTQSQHLITSSVTESSQTLKSEQNIAQNNQNTQIIQTRKKILKYQNSYHMKDIIKSVIIFLIFQFLAFFAQGQMPFFKFSKCDYIYYSTGLFIITLITISYLFYIKNSLCKKALIYKKTQIKVQIDMENSENFWKLVLGGFSAGFIQGTLGVGAGTLLMVVLLGFPINAMSAAATSGYQILFIGSGALIQQFINKKITLDVAAFFFLWSSISGGIVTYFFYKLVSKLDQTKVKKVLMGIILFTCILSLILIFPILIERINEKGWQFINQFHFQC